MNFAWRMPYDRLNKVLLITSYQNAANFSIRTIRLWQKCGQAVEQREVRFENQKYWVVKSENFTVLTRFLTGPSRTPPIFQIKHFDFDKKCGQNYARSMENVHCDGSSSKTLSTPYVFMQTLPERRQFFKLRKTLDKRLNEQRRSRKLWKLYIVSRSYQNAANFSKKNFGQTANKLKRSTDEK